MIGLAHYAQTRGEEEDLVSNYGTPLICIGALSSNLYEDLEPHLLRGVYLPNFLTISHCCDAQKMCFNHLASGLP